MSTRPAATVDRVPPAWLLVAAAVLLALAFGLVRDVQAVAQAGDAPDFLVFYEAGQRLSAGQPLYDPAAIQVAPFGQEFKLPPAVALVTQPLSALPLATAQTAWRWAIPLLVVLSALVLLWGARIGPRDLRWWLVLAVALGLEPVLGEVQDGQLQALLLVLTAVGVALTLRQRGAIGAGAIALAAGIKYFPGILVLPWLLRLRWGPLLGFGAGLGLILLASLAAGTGATATWLRDILPASGTTTGWSFNQTIAGALVRVTQGEVAGGDALFRSAAPDPGVALLAGLGFAVIIGASAWIILARAWGPERLQSARDVADEMGLLVPAVVLVIPVAWPGYQLLALIPLVLLASRWGNGLSLPRQSAFTLLVVAAVGLGLQPWLPWSPWAAAGAILVALLWPRPEVPRPPVLATFLVVAGFGFLSAPLPALGTLGEQYLLAATLLWGGQLLVLWPAPGWAPRPALAAAGAIVVLGLAFAGTRAWMDASRLAAGPVLASLPASVSPAADRQVWDRGIALAAWEFPDAPLQPGQALDVTLYWEPTSAVGQDLTRFVHLIDQPTGRTCGQDDATPAGGRVPTSAWRPGMVVQDRQQLVVPAGCPAGTYSLLTGFYDPATGTRLGMQTSPHTDYTIGRLTVGSPGGSP